MILIMSLSVTLWKVEQRAQDIQDIIVANNLASENLESISHIDRNYQVLVTEEPTEGLALPARVQKYLLPVTIAICFRCVT